MLLVRLSISRCNTKTIINPDYSIQVIAQDRIEAGQEITNQYMKADKPTIIRRPFLRQKWFFDCMCARCSDPTEQYERVLHQLSSQLHPYNHLMIDVKQKLALLYGNIAQYSMVTMGRPAKQRKVQLCMDVLDCLGKVVV